MDILEMHRAVRLGLDKNSYLPIPSFEPEELDSWINKAYNMYIDQCIETLIDSQKSESEKKRCQEILAPIYKFFGYETTNVSSFTSLGPNAWKCPSGNVAGLTNESVRYITEVYAKISRTLESGVSVTNQNVPCRFIPVTEIQYYVETPYNKPFFELPVYTFINFSSAVQGDSKGFVVLVDSQTSAISQVSVSYYSNPTNLAYSTPSVKCKLPDSEHQKIADLAVTLLIENIESERIKTQPIINKTLE